MLVLPIFFTLLATCECYSKFNKRVNIFSIELLKQTLEETQWHEVKSPLGIWSLLTTVSAGATGKSGDQLLHTLHLPKKRKTIVKKYNKYMKSVILSSKSDVQLKCNNFLFLDTGFETQEEFIQNITNDFSAKLTRIDFASATEAANKANSVIQETDHSVSNVFKPDDFKSAKIILTNTISFKGNWKNPFDASETRMVDFHDEMGKVIGQVNMMQQEGKFQYSHSKKIFASVLELPYGERNKYSFLAILPYPDVKLAVVYNALKTHGLEYILNQMKLSAERFGMPEVVVNLPRFKISTSVVLNTPLMNMGLADIFDPLKARFKLISKTANLYISTIVHKADIEVTETGTTASAASSAFYADRSLPSEFIANRPFLYFVVKKSTATIIFSGAYSIPTLY